MEKGGTLGLAAFALVVLACGANEDAPSAAGGSGGVAGSGGVSGSGGTSGSGGAPDSGTGGQVGAWVPAGAQSCAGGLTCNAESCCTSIVVPGGTFPQGRSFVVGASDYAPSTNPDSGPYGTDIPEHSATVSSFALDKYEVTVSRFRAFVAAYDAGWRPKAGDGRNANVTAGDTSWQPGWDDSAGGGTILPKAGAFTDASHLSSCTTSGAWTDSPGPNENNPINCVSWYEAFAFCIWDGGRLATESEWEYAAAGGSENRLYPWGAAVPDCTYANFYNYPAYCGPGGQYASADVGSYPVGNGKWGHADLGGNLWEWGFDYYGDYPASAVNDYANTVLGSYRVVRGGAKNHEADAMRAAHRNDNVPAVHFPTIGFRCARSAP